MDMRGARLLVFILSLVGWVPLAAAEPKVVDVSKSHYSGTWLEIGRTPMFITDGCVAGFTTYSAGKTPQEIDVLDGCYEGTPSGKLKSIRGKGRILDFETSKAKLRVRYPLFITFNYWVLYKSPDRSWFISADPKMNNLWIYARSAPTKKQLAVMVRKAQSLGYDVSKLEFPATK
jgi:apolipoprotein D and lipocalin family protein